MYLVNANTERLEEVEILTVPGLFTTRRVDRATLPPWMHLYEMQTDPDDWSQPGLLGLHITVEHFGTVLTASPLPLPSGGYLDLAPGDFVQGQGAERLTAAEFEAKYLDPDYQPPPAVRPEQRWAQPDKGGAAGKMKETNIKLFPVLDGLCGRTTPSTPASFRPDLWTLQAAVSEYEMEERTFYWLPVPAGGLCVRERDVFLRGSHGHRVWISQRPEAGEEAYCVILKGRDRDSPTGDIRSFDFSAHLPPPGTHGGGGQSRGTGLLLRAAVFYGAGTVQGGHGRFVLGIRDTPAHPVSAGKRGGSGPHDHDGASVSKGMWPEKGPAPPSGPVR